MAPGDPPDYTNFFVAVAELVKYTANKLKDISGSGDHNQRYGEPVTKPGGGADPTKNTAKITGPPINLGDNFLLMFSIAGSSPQLPSGPLAPAKITKKFTGAANEIIEQVSDNEPNNSNTSNTNNNEPSSTTDSKPEVKVVSSWGSPDSSKVSIKKDSLSNGNVVYTRRNLNNESEKTSNKNEFQRAWNNW